MIGDVLMADQTDAIEARRALLRPMPLVQLGAGDVTSVLAVARRAAAAGVRGIILKDDKADHHTMFRLAQHVRSGAPHVRVGLACSDLGPADLLRRVPDDVEFIWVDIPRQTGTLGRLRAVLHAARRERAWSGIACGDLGPLDDVLRASDRVRVARDSGQFDVLASSVAPSTDDDVAARVKTLRRMVWPLRLAILASSVLPALRADWLVTPPEALGAA